MFVVRLLLIFAVVPAALVGAAVLAPLTIRIWLLFVAFPLLLVVFAVGRFLSEQRRQATARAEDRR